ncbi:helix-turn-helix transcriptional regulator [Aliarcobacter cryaerophilus]|uniref:helix-turn-helix transcriptional regulator n=1 Tax=Aliarcobacter cryaerophilus TaxID=28198 RepID=UPI0013DE09DB|nr:helix-turn-helix domain-containing protein [Aliarcobacter cryaerophilus]
MENRKKTKYRAKELAEYLGIGLSTVWKWTKDGKIKAYNISKGVTVFDINEVLEDLGIK